MKTLKETLGNDLFEDFTNVTNRSRGQTEFLFQLVDDDFIKLIELEEKLKDNFVFYCPEDKETVNEVLKMEKTKLFVVRFSYDWNSKK